MAKRKIANKTQVKRSAQARSSLKPGKMKMTTKIPREITTSNSVKTRIGTLRFFDGMPDKSTVEKCYDNLDFLRGVEVFLNAMPGASVFAYRIAGKKFLVHRGLRRPDALNASDRRAVPEHRQPAKRRGEKCRRLRGCLFRPEGARRERRQLGADCPGQELERHPPPLRSGRTVVRKDLATGRHRVGVDECRGESVE